MRRRILHFQRWNLLVAAATVAAGALLLAASASASPVLFTIDSSRSSLTGSVSATFDISVNTNLGTFNGNGAVGPGALSSSPNGTLDVDWGNPGWDESITFDNLDMNNPNPGSASGGFSVNVILGFTADFTGLINIQNISVALENPVVTTPSPLNSGTPGDAGDGPWDSSAVGDLLLGATAGGSVQGTGLLSGVMFTIDPFTFGGTPPGQPVPLAGELRRVTGGSELEFDVMGASINVPSGDPTTINVNQCVISVIFGCNLRVNSITLTVTSLTLDNLNGTVVATSTTEIPEPATAGLVGLGCAGLALLARRRRR